MLMLHRASAQRDVLIKAIAVAELCLVPLTNDLVALITWRFGLDLFPVLAVALYSYVGIRHLRILGIRFRWSWYSVRFAALAGLALAVPSLLFFFHPVLVGNVNRSPVTPATVGAVSGLLRSTLIDLPVLTAIIEELVFREFLYFETRALPLTLVINASLFTLWHGVAGYTTIASTSFGKTPGLLLLAYIGGLAAVFVGGVVFAYVRHVTGSFIYSALTHWLCDATIIFALFGSAHFGW